MPEAFYDHIPCDIMDMYEEHDMVSWMMNFVSFDVKYSY